MRLSARLLPLLVLAACRSSVRPPNPAILDPIARRYVSLALAMGAHDPDYVDA